MNYIGCKIQLYIVFLPAILARLMLILASFDRFCSSSKSTNRISISTNVTCSNNYTFNFNITIWYYLLFKISK